MRRCDALKVNQHDFVLLLINQHIPSVQVIVTYTKVSLGSVKVIINNFMKPCGCEVFNLLKEVPLMEMAEYYKSRYFRKPFWFLTFGLPLRKESLDRRNKRRFDFRLG